MRWSGSRLVLCEEFHREKKSRRFLSWPVWEEAFCRRTTGLLLVCLLCFFLKRKNDKLVLCLD
jgi:hypothetical protein